MKNLNKVPVMGRESLAAIIDVFEDFLEAKGVEKLPKGAVVEGETAMIYGKDYDELIASVSEILKSSGICVPETYDAMEAPVADTEDITIFVPSKGEILLIKEGSGCNLLDEDKAEGYVDYIYFDVYKATEPESQEDGGELMSKEYLREKYSSMADAIPEVLEYRYDDKDLTYIILGGGKPFLMTPKRLADAWAKVVDLFDPCAAYDKKITPDDTARDIVKALGGIAPALEVFAAVVRFKDHDGRISPRNRTYLNEIPIDTGCLVMEHGNPFFNGKLDAIHTSYINQMADSLIKYAESVKG